MELIKPLTMPLDEFIRLYDEEGPFEYVNGERIPMSPNKIWHGIITRTLLLAIQPYSVAHNLGEVFSEIPVALEDSPNWVKGSRVPDVMFFRAERLAAFKAATPDWREKPFLIVPDLAVEIISPTDRYNEVYDKAAGYLADGVQIVWLIDPQHRRVITMAANSNQQTMLKEGDSLDGGAIIPGLTIPITALFA